MLRKVCSLWVATAQLSARCDGTQNRIRYLLSETHPQAECCTIMVPKRSLETKIRIFLKIENDYLKNAILPVWDIWSRCLGCFSFPSTQNCRAPRHHPSQVLTTMLSLKTYKSGWLIRLFQSLTCARSDGNTWPYTCEIFDKIILHMRRNKLRVRLVQLYILHR